MKQIPVQSKEQIYFVLVDDEDYPLLSRHKWYILFSGKLKRPYAFTRFYTEHDKKNGKTFLMHHMIMGTSGAVDHWNQNSLDNQKENLRVATYQQNGWNKPKNKTSRGKATSSKYKGVSYAPLNGKDRWVALIRDGDKYTGKVIRLGYFDTEDDAARAYNKKVIELRGQYAWLNPIYTVNPALDEKVVNIDKSKG